jgi:hypothetical protein
MDSRAAILEWSNSNMAGQNEHDSYGVIQAGCEKRLWLLIDEEHEGGGVTDDTSNTRYALLWSVSAAHYTPPFFEKTRPRVYQ